MSQDVFLDGVVLVLVFCTMPIPKENVQASLCSERSESPAHRAIPQSVVWCGRFVGGVKISSSSAQLNLSEERFSVGVPVHQFHGVSGDISFHNRRCCDSGGLFVSRFTAAVEEILTQSADKAGSAELNGQSQSTNE